MKIKDVSGERSFTIFKDVMPYITKFSKNRYFRSIFSKEGLPDDVKKQGEILTQRLAEYLPDLIQNSKDDLVAYFSFLEGITPEEYLKDVSAGKIFDGITDMFCDESFRTFFTPLLNEPLEKD